MPPEASMAELVLTNQVKRMIHPGYVSQPLSSATFVSVRSDNGSRNGSYVWANSIVYLSLRLILQPSELNMDQQAVETDTEPLIWLHSLRRLVNDLVVGWLHQTPSTLEGVVIHPCQNWYHSGYRSAFHVHRASTRTSIWGCTKYLMFHMTLSQTKKLKSHREVYQ